MAARGKRQEFKQIQENHKIRLLIDTTREQFVFSYDPTPSADGCKRINLGLAALERVWAYCYAFASFDSLLEKRPPGELIFLKEESSVESARRLINIADVAQRANRRMEFPEDLPRPDRSMEEIDINVANNLFLLVTAFIITHEMGHICLNHPPANFITMEQSVREERNADAWAANFILSGWEASTDEIGRVARANAISAGMALLASVELELHPEQRRNHPKVPDRLLEFFANHLPVEDGTASLLKTYPRRFACAMLYAFMLSRNIQFNYTEKYDTYTDLLFALRGVF
jgi:hypothetical protein